MIFLDSNVPMYLVGSPHPHKTEAQILVERAIASQDRLITDAEVFQEILHRYSLLRRRDDIPTALRVTLGLVDDVLPIEQRDVLRAAEIVRLPEAWSARDALHLAIMERHGIRRIMSFDRDFDRWPGLSRIHEV
ncbi:MAG TPA: type II toxin-antitoxin system VapC family toxin [Bryobacteraceae bacterium]|nr:type II toxin-antitoxin system VapC family toxin [Bryobacteraceae bacterium]